ncbi:hypothetical protein DIPPA_18097 [Diplonema papillatum]|nr:hypothetical protein DIPPA_18097 [Diplonema papillatum]
MTKSVSVPIPELERTLDDADAYLRRTLASCVGSLAPQTEEPRPSRFGSTVAPGTSGGAACLRSRLKCNLRCPGKLSANRNLA